MSAGLAPSKITVYVSNLPFSLANNNLQKILKSMERLASEYLQDSRTL
jgi:hypothetical protein